MSKFSLSVWVPLAAVAYAVAVPTTHKIIDGEYKPLAAVSVARVCPGGGLSVPVSSGADGSFTIDTQAFCPPDAVGEGFSKISIGNIHSVEFYTLQGRLVGSSKVQAFFAQAQVPEAGIYIQKWLGPNFSELVRAYAEPGKALRVPETKRIRGLGKSLADSLTLRMTKDGYTPKQFTFLAEAGLRTFNFGAPVHSRNLIDPLAPKYNGYQLELNEEFNQPIPMDNTDPIWRAGDGTWGVNFVRFDPAAISFADGSMVITMDKMDMPASPSVTEAENFISGVVPAGRITAKTYRSGEFRTKAQAYRYGRYEVAIDPPNREDASGFIATMFAYHTPGEKTWREIDIEVEGNNSSTLPSATPHQLLTNVFFNNGTAEWKPDAEFTDRAILDATVDMREKQIYAFEWTPGQVRFFVNGKRVRTVRTNDKAGVEVGAKPTKIIMNFWLCCGGGVGGAWDKNKASINVKYDFFRFYRWNEDGSHPVVDCTTATGLNCPK